MLKKQIYFLVVILLIGFVVGCSSAKDTKKGGSSDLIVYTQKTMNEFFHVALQENAEKAALAAGYKFEAANCNNDTTLQNDQLHNFIAKRPAAIIANAVDSDAFNDATNAAMNAGIPVIMVDNPASTAVVSCTIAFDNYKCGYMAAELLVDALIAKNGSAKGRVVNVYGAMSSECWRLRKEGFDAYIKKHPDIEYIEVPGEGEQSRSQEALTNAIAQYDGDIDAVHSPSDSPALGCCEALKIADMWYPVGNPNHIIFVTCDGGPDAVELLLDGYYDSVVVEDACSYGPMAVEMLVNYIFKGEKVPTSGTFVKEDSYWKSAELTDSDRGPVVMIPPYVLDMTNVEDEGHWGVQALEQR